MIKITKNQAAREDWDQVKSWNYKFPQKSVVTATLDGPHNWATTDQDGYYYYILEGEGIFETHAEKIVVAAGEALFVPPQTEYNYYPTNGTTLKIVLFMNPWLN